MNTNVFVQVALTHKLHIAAVIVAFKRLDSTQLMGLFLMIGEQSWCAERKVAAINVTHTLRIGLMYVLVVREALLSLKHLRALRTMEAFIRACIVSSAVVLLDVKI